MKIGSKHIAMFEKKKKAEWNLKSAVRSLEFPNVSTKLSSSIEKLNKKIVAA